MIMGQNQAATADPEGIRDYSADRYVDRFRIACMLAGPDTAGPIVDMRHQQALCGPADRKRSGKEAPGRFDTVEQGWRFGTLIFHGLEGKLR